ncbi:hypothetical protein CJ030_MR3G001162 [Morella rubra]|uniref:EF-hand domain-containing protein n=1 Tax=Morella rubra TaxID=262757 RepID=A0A6A1W2P5_9ROSI|nr:hypothetical protein CJ030_MR3G001162 [Morella rubra]
MAINVEELLMVAQANYNDNGSGDMKEGALKLFKKMDKNGDRKISFNELDVFFKELGSQLLTREMISLTTTNFSFWDGFAVPKNPNSVHKIFLGRNLFIAPTVPTRSLQKVFLGRKLCYVPKSAFSGGKDYVPK